MLRNHVVSSLPDARTGQLLLFCLLRQETLLHINFDSAGGRAHSQCIGVAKKVYSEKTTGLYKSKIIYLDLTFFKWYRDEKLHRHGIVILYYEGLNSLKLVFSFVVAFSL